jgi:hypothetical protein
VFLQEQHVSTQLRGHHQVGIVMKLKMAVHKQLDPVDMPTAYVLPFSISLLYQPDDGTLVGLKHVAVVKTFYYNNKRYTSCV